MRIESIDDYVLPVDKPAIIGQGFHGQFSHKVIETPEGKVDDSYALDFLLEPGSNVYAARGGIVVHVDVQYVPINFLDEQGREDPKLREEAINSTNNIIIKHDDGTFGIYSHLQQNAALVSMKQRVEQGQPIALSGNTGYSTQPHLHFAIYSKEPNDGFLASTVPISFIDYEGELEDRDIKL